MRYLYSFRPLFVFHDAELDNKTSYLTLMMSSAHTQVVETSITHNSIFQD